MQIALVVAAVLGTASILNVAVVGRASATTAPVGQSGAWNLVFEDDFEGGDLDDEKWVRCYWWDAGGCTNLGNAELQWYLPENVSVVDGALRLTAQRETTFGLTDTYDFTSGLVTTGRLTSDRTGPPKFEFQYGYTEIRARLPVGRGLWPAFWLMPSRQVPVPEIDVLEVLGQEPDRLHFAFHYRDQIGRTRHVGKSFLVPDTSEDWHVYAIRWSPDRIVWYFDGEELWRYDDVRYVPQEPMYLLLNLAIGGIWAGPPNSKTQFPAEYAIDYIRVWQMEE